MAGQLTWKRAARGSKAPRLGPGVASPSLGHEERGRKDIGQLLDGSIAAAL